VSNALATNCTAIGAGATVSSSDAGLGIGPSTSISGDQSVGIGRGTTVAASNHFVAGSGVCVLTTFYLGSRGVTNATPTAVLWTATGGSAVGINGASISICPGLGGTAADSGGNLDLQVALSGTGTTRTSIFTILASTGDIRLQGDHDMVPAADDDWELGTDALRLSRVRAVAIVSGDLGFYDERCPACGEALDLGEDLLLRPVRRERSRGPKSERRALMCVPVHARCAGYRRDGLGR
jgi:hypothetical protein